MRSFTPGSSAFTALLGLVLFPMFLCCVALGQEAGTANSGNVVNGGVEIDWASKYLWRGLALSSGVVMQSTTWLGFGPASIALWTNYDLASSYNENRLNEYDAIVSYSTSVGPAALTPGATFQRFPNDASLNTTELSLGFSLALGQFALTSTHHLDVDLYSGAYFVEFSGAYSRSLGRNLTGDLTGGVGGGGRRFNAYNLGRDKRTLNVAFADLGFSWNALAWLTVRPHAGVCSLIDRDLRGAVAKPTLANLGLSASVEF